MKMYQCLYIDTKGKNKDVRKYIEEVMKSSHAELNWKRLHVCDWPLLNSVIGILLYIDISPGPHDLSGM